MKQFDLRFVFFIFLLAVQLACGQTQTISNNSQNKTDIVVTKNNPNIVKNSEKVKEEIDYFAHMQPEHKEVLQNWLKSKPSLRPAVEKVDTSLDKSVLENVHKKGWTQFYTIADINKDGNKDFAVLLVDMDGNDKFVLAIFNGRFNKAQSPNFTIENLNGISNSVISYENKRDYYFSSSSYLLLYDKKRNSCAGLVPDKNTYKVIICM